MKRFLNQCYHKVQQQVTDRIAAEKVIETQRATNGRD